MRHAESGVSSGSGVTSLLSNLNAHQRWVRSTHSRSQYKNMTMQMVELAPNSVKDKHGD